MPTALVGSVSQQVAIQSAAPWWSSGHVVVGLDGSAASEPALGYAFAYAASTPSTLTPAHAWWWEPLQGDRIGEPWIGDWTQIASQQEAMLSESLAGWSQRYPDVHLQSHVVRGDRHRTPWVETRSFRGGGNRSACRWTAVRCFLL